MQALPRSCRLHPRRSPCPPDLVAAAAPGLWLENLAQHASRISGGRSICPERAQADMATARRNRSIRWSQPKTRFESNPVGDASFRPVGTLKNAAWTSTVQLEPVGRRPDRGFRARTGSPGVCPGELPYVSTRRRGSGVRGSHSTTLKISREPDSQYGTKVSYQARHSEEPVTFFISCSNADRFSN